MQTTLDKISFDPKHFWCLHVANYDQIETLYRELSRRFKSDNINGIVVAPASLDTVRRRLLRQPTDVEWLTQNAGISSEAAATIIDGFPIRVAPRMNQNAMNPRRFLGLAAAIAKNPDLIVYATSGMDPRGISLIHKYASAHYPDGCLIHVSAHPVGNVLTCPNGAQCVTVPIDRHESDA